MSGSGQSGSQISKYQNIKISKYQALGPGGKTENVHISKYQNIKISKYQNIGACRGALSPPRPAWSNLTCSPSGAHFDLLERMRCSNTLRSHRGLSCAATRTARESHRADRCYRPAALRGVSLGPAFLFAGPVLAILVHQGTDGLRMPLENCECGVLDLGR